MAINYNINPYQVGAVVFDNKPYLQFHQQQLAQRRAKEAALDNYFRDLGKNITPAGMRNQDVEGLTKRTNEWRQFYVQNKDAISNPRLDGGKAYTEYMSRYQDQLGYIDKSKNRLKVTDELGKLRLDPNRSFMLDDPTLMDKAHTHDLPLDDPNSKDLNLMEISSPPKPWGIKDKEAYSKYLTSGLQYNETPGKTEYLPNFQTRTPITKQYSDENLRVIGQRAMSAYDTDRALQFQTNKLTRDILNDPELHDQLNKSFKRIYGKDIETPKELLAAQAITEENRKSTEFKMGDDDYGRQKALEAIRFGHQKELKKGEQQAADNWIVNFWNTRINNAKSGQPTPLPDPNNPLTIKMSYEIQPDAVMMKGLSRNNIEPDAVFVTTDNKIMPVFYKYQDDYNENGKKVGTSVKTDANGNPEIDATLSRAMDIDQAYLSLGYRGETKKQLSETMQGAYGGAKKVADKPKRVIQGGHEYILNEKTGQYE
jgi:hypothetical protein